MPRYIDADEFVKRVIKYPRQSTKTIGLALADTPTADVVEKERYDRLLENATIISEALDEYQTADVPERNVGKWEKKWHSYFKQELPCCSVCGHFSAMRWKYCPNCGADMRGGPDAQLD